MVVLHNAKTYNFINFIQTKTLLYTFHILQTFHDEYEYETLCQKMNSLLGRVQFFLEETYSERMETSEKNCFFQKKRTKLEESQIYIVGQTLNIETVQSMCEFKATKCFHWHINFHIYLRLEKDIIIWTHTICIWAARRYKVLLKVALNLYKLD